MVNGTGVRGADIVQIIAKVKEAQAKQPKFVLPESIRRVALVRGGGFGAPTPARRVVTPSAAELAAAKEAVRQADILKIRVEQKSAQAKQAFEARDVAFEKVKGIDDRLKVLKSSIVRQRILPVAQARSIREFERLSKERSGLTGQFEKQQELGLERVAEARRIGGAAFPEVGIRERVVLPKPVDVVVGRPFGPESIQLAAAAARAVRPTPLEELPSATRQREELLRARARFERDLTVSIEEARRLGIVSRIPLVSEKEAKVARERVRGFEVERGRLAGEQLRLERELKKFGQFAGTRERFRFLAERAPFAIVPEVTGLGLGEFARRLTPAAGFISPKVKAPPVKVGKELTQFVVPEVVFPKQKVVFGAQQLGAFTGEIVQLEAAFPFVAKALRSLEFIPKPSIRTETFFRPIGKGIQFERVGEVKGLIRRKPFIEKGIVRKLDDFIDGFGKLGKEVKIKPDKSVFKFGALPEQAPQITKRAGGFRIFGEPTRALSKAVREGRLTDILFKRTRGFGARGPRAVGFVEPEVFAVRGVRAVGRQRVKSIFQITPEDIAPVFKPVTGKAGKISFVQEPVFGPFAVRPGVTKALRVLPEERFFQVGLDVGEEAVKAARRFGVRRQVGRLPELPTGFRDFFSAKEIKEFLPAVRRFPVQVGGPPLGKPVEIAARKGVSLFRKIKPGEVFLDPKTFLKEAEVVRFAQVTGKPAVVTIGETAKGIRFTDVARLFEGTPIGKAEIAAQKQLASGILRLRAPSLGPEVPPALIGFTPLITGPRVTPAVFAERFFAPPPKGVLPGERFFRLPKTREVTITIPKELPKVETIVPFRARTVAITVERPKVKPGVKRKPTVAEAALEADVRFKEFVSPKKVKVSDRFISRSLVEELRETAAGRAIIFGIQPSKAKRAVLPKSAARILEGLTLKESQKGLERLAAGVFAGVAQRQRALVGFGIAPITAQRVIARAREAERAITKTIFGEPFPPTKPFVFLPPILPPPPQQAVRARKTFESFVEGFFPVTRKAGREVILTPFPVTEKAARAIAIKEVIGTPRAAFAVVRAGRPAVRVRFPTLPAGIERQFRPAKTLPGFFVEKPKFRIREPGELRGITLKGLEKLAAFPELRRKRKKKAIKKKAVKKKKGKR